VVSQLVVEANMQHVNQHGEVLERRRVMDTRGEDIEGRSDTLFQDLVWQRFLSVRSFLEQAFKASPGCAEDIGFFSLEILEVDSDDLGFDLHCIEVYVLFKGVAPAGMGDLSFLQGH